MCVEEGMWVRYPGTAGRQLVVSVPCAADGLIRLEDQRIYSIKCVHHKEWPPAEKAMITAIISSTTGQW